MSDDLEISGGVTKGKRHERSGDRDEGPIRDYETGSGKESRDWRRGKGVKQGDEMEHTGHVLIRCYPGSNVLISAYENGSRNPGGGRAKEGGHKTPYGVVCSERVSKGEKG